MRDEDLRQLNLNAVERFLLDEIAKLRARVTQIEHDLKYHAGDQSRHAHTLLK